VGSVVGRQTQLIEAALSSGQSVVVDNTNSRVQDRAALVAQAKRHGARVVGYYFPSSIKDALERNSARTGSDVVPAVAILSTAKIFRPPSYAEGFDELYLVCRAESAFSVQTYLEDECGCG
jgi:predicted kinase